MSSLQCRLFTFHPVFHPPNTALRELCKQNRQSVIPSYLRQQKGEKRHIHRGQHTPESEKAYRKILRDRSSPQPCTGKSTWPLMHACAAKSGMTWEESQEFKRGKSPKEVQGFLVYANPKLDFHVQLTTKRLSGLIL